METLRKLYRLKNILGLYRMVYENIRDNNVDDQLPVLLGTLERLDPGNWPETTEDKLLQNRDFVLVGLTAVVREKLQKFDALVKALSPEQRADKKIVGLVFKIFAQADIFYRECPEALERISGSLSLLLKTAEKKMLPRDFKRLMLEVAELLGLTVTVNVRLEENPLVGIMKTSLN